MIVNLAAILALVLRERDHQTERYQLLERIQRPERVPSVTRIPIVPHHVRHDVSMNHERPDEEIDETEFVGMIDPPIRDESNRPQL